MNKYFPRKNSQHVSEKNLTVLGAKEMQSKTTKLSDIS